MQAVRRSAHVRARLKCAVRSASRPRPFATQSAATVRPFRPVSLSGKPWRFDRAPRPSAVRQFRQASGNAATVRAAQPFRPMSAATVRPCAAPVSGSTVRPWRTSNAAPPSNAARIPASRGERAATVPACLQSAATVCRIRRNIERGKDSGKRPATVCQSIRQAVANIAATYPATVRQLPPSNAATYPATSNAANVRRLSAVRPWRTSNAAPDSSPPCASHSGKPWRTSNAANAPPPFRPVSLSGKPWRFDVRRLSAVRPSAPDSGQCQRQPSANLSGKDSGDRVPVYPASRGKHRGNLSGDRAPVIPANICNRGEHGTRRPIRQHRTRQTCRACQRQPFAACQPFDRAPPMSHFANVSFCHHRTPRRIPPRPCASHSGEHLQPFDRGEHGTRQPCATVPACQSIRQAVATVRRIRRQPIRHHRTRRAGFRPMLPDSARRPFNRCPSALQSRQPFAPVPRRLAAIAPKTALQAVRRSAHVRARLKRAVRFASRPRPVCNAISASRPAIRQGFRRPSATVATVRPFRPVSLSGKPWRFDRAPRLSAVRQFRQASGNAATVRAAQPFRPVCNQRRPCASLSGKPQPFDRAPPVSGNRSPPQSPETRRNRPPLRFSAPDGFAPVPPCRALARPFYALCKRPQNVRQGFRQHRTRRTCRALQP